MTLIEFINEHFGENYGAMWEFQEDFLGGKLGSHFENDKSKVTALLGAISEYAWEVEESE